MQALREENQRLKQGIANLQKAYERAAREKERVHTREIEALMERHAKELEAKEVEMTKQRLTLDYLRRALRDEEAKVYGFETNIAQMRFLLEEKEGAFEKLKAAHLVAQQVVSLGNTLVEMTRKE